MRSTDHAATNDHGRLEAVRRRPHAEVVVVGGGINGIATFRDLAMQGVDVVLVERGDYASGASAASSHMIHGGVRYLENGEFRLVRESVEERNRLLEIAPHYVKPLETTIPIFRTFAGIVHAPLRFLTHKAGGRHVERGAALIKIGLTLYDSFSGSSAGARVPRHRFRGRRRALADLPELNPDIRYTATYFDASVHDPERLALDVLRDGLDAGGAAVAGPVGGEPWRATARAANYLEATALSDSGVHVRDVVTGEEFELGADVVVNASGPWTDLTNEAFGLTTRHMGGTKGSHIVLDNDELLAATGGREIFFEHSDGRIVLVYPMKGRVLVGTTDLEHDMRDPAVCTEAEVDYFFELIQHVFPGVAVSRDDIVFRFSGVRPLPKHDDLQPGFVSRDYRIVDEGETFGPRLFSLVGGKWTTFRALGEHLAGDVLAALGRERVTSTAGVPIGGGRGYPASESARRVWVAAHADGVGGERAARLLERYGTRAAELIDELAELSDAPLQHAPAYSRAEIAYLARTEFVVHLTDLVLRRTSLAFRGELSLPLLAELADVAGEVLGWDAARRRAEIDAATRMLAERHGVLLGHSGGTAGATAGMAAGHADERDETGRLAAGIH
jgi:glycerol-3-phosphate dehydrogenase